MRKSEVGTRNSILFAPLGGHVARRILKWTGIVMCVLIPVTWIVSVFAGVRVVTPVGSIALHRGVVSIVQSPPMAEFDLQHAAANSMVKESKEWLRKAETEITADEARAAVTPILEDAARQMVKSAEDGQAAHAAIWGIPVVTTPGRTMGILWLKPYGPRLSRPGLGLQLPTYLIHASQGYWPGMWIPLWLIALLAAVAWGIICWRRRPILPGHCMTCGYDLTGNTSGVCPECGDKACPLAVLADSECGMAASVAHEKSGRSDPRG